MQATKLMSRASALTVQQPSLTLFRAFASSNTFKQRVSELIKHDHAELRIYKNNIINGANGDEKRRWQNQFVWELARHSIAEELVVYPAMEKNIPGGKEMANRDRLEHQKVKDLLYHFQNLRPGDKEFTPVLDALWENLENHIKEEESHDLPLLEKHTPPIDSANLSTDFDRCKMFVPTRSHPMAPNTGGPFETVASLMTAPLDRLGDMFRRYPKTH
ncbi:hemerythrin HHE cation binding domain protein [Aureobasidium subglaciale]|nr:hemerythrin HHE cation binding domain protein [Aureobasidium subglaciale]